MNKILLFLFLSTVSIAQVAADAATLRREASVAFVEGPAWHTDGSVYFTDIPNNRIMRWPNEGRPIVHRSPAGHANGLLFDKHGRLLIAEDDGRLVRENLDGSIEVLADEYNGMRLNALNDLAMDTMGRVYFTDPRYKDRHNATQRDADGNIIDGVYRLDENGKLTRLLAGEVERPNGVLVSPKDQYLYVADNNGQAPDGARKVWRFDLDNSGDVIKSSQKLIFDWMTGRGPDGMTIDSLGNLYVAAGRNTPIPNQTSRLYKAGIYVISPEGKLLEFIPVPIDPVTNVTFGGEEYRTLYITAGHNLWSYKVDTPGYLPFER